MSELYVWIDLFLFFILFFVILLLWIIKFCVKKYNYLLYFYCNWFIHDVGSRIEEYGNKDEILVKNKVVSQCLVFVL